MTTFNTVEDLMRVLDENPHLMEAVRSRVLTRELLDLPQTVARLADRVEQIAEQLAQLTERVDRLTDRVDRLTDRVEQLALTFEDRWDRTNRRLDQIVDDLGRLKNIGTITTARDHAEVIASVLGLRCQKQLRRNEIIDLSVNQNASDIRPGDLTSFRQADLIMEATDDDGKLHYIAVEASFTADERDTRRAIRNAGYLTRFTGQPARAVIAAMRIDREIQPVLDSGQAVWYQLEEPDTD